MKTLKVALAVAFVFTACAVDFAGFGQKLEVDEIIRKHAESVGTEQTRNAAKNYFAVGASSFASKLPSKKTAGKALIVSQDDNLFFLTSFASQEYPYEKIGYFDKKTSLPFVTAGARSPLGAFIADHPSLLSHGLFGGTISRSWPFLDRSKIQGKISGGGTKKIDGRKAYVIEYFPSAGSTEFSVKLYFDAETFAHIRSEYLHVIAPQPELMGTLGRQTGVKLALTETFGDFKTEEGMTLPHTYKITYLTDSNAGVYEFEWGVNISTYYFNQKLEPDFFTFDPKPAKQ